MTPGQDLVRHAQDLFLIPEQVQQQDVGAEQVDHYLSGKGLCARALYDYQAGMCWVLAPSNESASGEEVLGSFCGLAPTGLQEKKQWMNRMGWITQNKRCLAWTRLPLILTVS